MLIIENISQHLDMLETITCWHRKEWGSEWAEQVHQSTNSDKIPTMYVAIEDGNAVGTAMLINIDMKTHPDTFPWLGGVYVTPEYRHRGIAAALSRHAMHEAARMGVKQLWLYTVSARRLYEKLGWKFHKEEDYLGEQATIMKIDLNHDGNLAK